MLSIGGILDLEENYKHPICKLNTELSSSWLLIMRKCKTFYSHWACAMERAYFEESAFDREINFSDKAGSSNIDNQTN